jgi:hypothetical protein
LRPEIVVDVGFLGFDIALASFTPCVGCNLRFDGALFLEVAIPGIVE